MISKKIVNKNKVTSIFWPIAILFFTYQMFLIIFPYTSWRLDIDFLLTKQHIIHLNHYHVAFYAHIFSSIFVLLSGAFLFSKYILKKLPKLHRLAGNTYVVLLLLISAPSGFIMGFYANGGWAVQLSFFILTPLWWWFTFMGYKTARNKNFTAHKKWMMRSYALTLSAISLRFYQLLLGYFLVIDLQLQYVLVSWGSWVGNLVLIELWIHKNRAWGMIKLKFGSLIYLLKSTKNSNPALDFHRHRTDENRTRGLRGRPINN